MAADKRKILEAARKHAQKGAKDKALNEFGKLLKLDPRDSKLRLELGDTYRRWGQIGEAIGAYSVVADQFMHEGFDARAVAVFKQIQNLQPDTFTSYEPLAELYQRMGLTAEAIGCLEAAAEGYRKAGQKQEALGLLRKMAAIDPSNTTSRIKVADLLHQEGLKEQAVSEYDAVISELELQGDSEAAGKVFERILEVEPGRVETIARYARNLIEQGATERAEALAKRALGQDRSPEHFELLADVYRLEKRDEDLVALYRELAELYRERGDEERTREILQRYVPLDEIGSKDTPNGYISDDEKLGDDELLDDLLIGDETTLLDGDLLSDTTLLVSDDDSGFGILSRDGDLDDIRSGPLSPISDSNEMTRLSPNGSLAKKPAGDSGPRDDEIDVGQLLAEASVYLRYGKRNQAIANLESILARDLDHRLALEKLGEAYAEGDDVAKAVEMWSRAARLAAESGEVGSAELLRSRVAALDPTAAGKLELSVARAAGSAPRVAGPTPRAAGPAPRATGSAPRVAGSTPRATESAPRAAGPTPRATGSAPGRQGIADDLSGESSDELSIPDDPAGVTLDPETARFDDSELPELDLAEISVHGIDIEIDIDDASFAQPSASDASTGQSSLAAAAGGLGSAGDAELDEISITDISVRHGAAGDEDAVDDAEVDSDAMTFSGPSESNASPEKVAEDLEEADFYLEQGLLDEAEAVYSRIVALLPNHPHAMVRLGEISAQRGHHAGPGVGAPATTAANSEPENGESAALAGSDIGEDLANWQGNLGATAAIARETALLKGAEAVEAGDAKAESVAAGARDEAAKDFAADLGFEDSGELDLDSNLGDDAAEDQSQSDEQDETGSLASVPKVSETPGESVADAGRADSVAALAEASDDHAAEHDHAPEQGHAPVQGHAPEPDGDPFGFDLAAELSQSLDRDAGASSSRIDRAAGRGNTSEDGFASVFAEFKKGVSAALSEGDYQAHYDLGIAYREMGLFSDAIGEFRLAMGDPERRIGCLHLLGMCAQDTGEPEQAIGHLKEALASSGLSNEMIFALKLDLGKSYEATGDIASARMAYEEVQALDPNFADVASRLAELQKSEESDPREGASVDTDEYESFDEFLGDLDDSAPIATQSAPIETQLAAIESKAATQAGAATEAPPIWESFDDVVAEVEAADSAESRSGAAEKGASSGPVGEEDAGDLVEADESAEKTPKRRKKKISFV